MVSAGLPAVHVEGQGGLADVVADPSLAQFTVAKKQVFSAARHSAAFSWNVFAGSAKVAGRYPPGPAFCAVPVLPATRKPVTSPSGAAIVLVLGFVIAFKLI